MHPLTLRRLRPSEGRFLQTKLHTSTLPVRRYQRYRIVAEAARGRTVPEIVDRVGCHEQTVSSVKSLSGRCIVGAVIMRNPPTV